MLCPDCGSKVYIKNSGSKLHFTVCSNHDCIYSNLDIYENEEQQEPNAIQIVAKRHMLKYLNQIDYQAECRQVYFSVLKMINIYQ